MRKTINEYNSDFFLARTPFLPLNNILDFYNSSKNEVNFRKLKNYFFELIDENFKEGILIASYSLFLEFKTCSKNFTNYTNINDELFFSLLKYYIRMSARSTPFGLFAGCTVGKYSKNITKITLVPKSKNIRKTYLDIEFLLKIYQNIESNDLIKKQLIYYPNNTIYYLHNKLRYVEYSRLKEDKRNNLIDVNSSDTINKIISKAELGLEYEKLSKYIQELGYGISEAEFILNDLISSQILVSELLVNITGEEYILNLIKILKAKKNVEPITKDLIKIKDYLENCNKIPQLNNGNYEKIKNIISKYTEIKKASTLIHVDLIKPSIDEATLDKVVLKDILKALEILKKISSAASLQIANFKNKFFERYEGLEVSLVEVLDSEIGIGFLELDNPTNNLVDDIYFDKFNVSNNINLTEYSVFIKEKYISAIKKNIFEIEITDEEIEKFPDSDLNLPTCFSVFCNILNNTNSKNIHLGAAMTPSATIYLGRFCRSYPELFDELIKTVRKEEALNKDKIFASIVYLQEGGRAGNIAIRPHIRKYEIPYQSFSTLPNENQIDIKDLYISIKNNKLILRSKKHGKEVVPRLDNAHNYSSSKLPIYNFLCSMQYQNEIDSLHWNWSFLQNEDFLPRVVYKNVILSLATWHIKTMELNSFHKLGNEELIEKFEEYKVNKKIPNLVLFSQSDNNLLLDLSSEVSIRLLLSLCKNKSNIKLTEFLNSCKDSLIKNKEGSFSNEIIIPFYKNTLIADSLKEYVDIADSYSLKVKRQFSPGSEWAYYKVYCGIKSADRILIDYIQPLLHDLFNQRLIDKWFFIRYSDPEFHLRIRFHIVNPSKNCQVLESINKKLAEIEQNKLAWKFQIDTYQREIERYGEATMEMSEEVFSRNSTLVLNILYNLQKKEFVEYRWVAGAIGIDYILNLFSLDLNHKLSIIDQLKESFGNEFNIETSKGLRESIKVKCRKNLPIFIHFMGGKKDYNIPISLKYIFNEIFSRDLELEKINIKKIIELTNNNDIGNTISSYIHMYINRLMESKPRECEFILYSIVSKYYQYLISSIKTH